MQTIDEEQIIDRVAALDVGKAEVVCCIRLPGGKRRTQEVMTVSTMVPELMKLGHHLHTLGVSRVVMEATSDYWRSPYYIFEAFDLDPWLVNAHDVKHVPGRPKTDTLDAVWLCKLAERQMLRPSFVPPHDIRRLRQLTRYRTNLVSERTAEKARVEKLLEDACIKLSVVATDIFGTSGRTMLNALIAGETDPAVLADLAIGRMRPKITQLTQAFAGIQMGSFSDDHRFLLIRMLARIDSTNDEIALLDAKIAEHMAPFAHQVAQLCEIPGISTVAAAALIAEIGVDMTHFDTPHNLTSWARLAPGVKRSAGKDTGTGATGKGNKYIARTLGESVAAISKTHTFLGARYRRIARRRGKSKANVAVQRSTMIAVWHLLADPDAHFDDLGPDHYEKHRNTSRATRHHIQALQSLGYRVTLTPAA